MKEMYKTRLLLLADKLDKVHKEYPEKFDFNNYIRGTWHDFGSLNLETTCGTSGCALGWATTIPELQKLGFRLVQGAGLYAILASDSWEDLAIKAFGINRTECSFLFIPAEYENSLPKDASAKEVADRIREFVSIR